MKRLMVLGVGIIVGGCAGVKQQDLDRLREQMGSKRESAITELRSDFNTSREDYLKMRELHQESQKLYEQLVALREELGKLDAILNAKVKDSTEKVLRIVEFEEKYFSLRLAELRQIIEDLKKPAGGGNE